MKRPEAEMVRHQKLPTEWKKREKLREKGQFWTPMWVAEAMVAYVSQSSTARIFDPAVGGGVFFRAARNILGQDVVLEGTEIDSVALSASKEHGLTSKDLQGVMLLDFMELSDNNKYPAVVANPPYIRHHRIDSGYKSQLKFYCKQLTGFTLDGRAGFHVYFLLKALSHLEQNGSLAFIMPADTCEGVFSTPLWQWITTNFRLEYVVTFAPEATPFPGVDTNAIVFCIRNTHPIKHLQWIKCLIEDGEFLRRALSGQATLSSNLLVHTRELQEALLTGLSRAFTEGEEACVPLGDIAKVVRGIATGANEFFFLTEEDAKKKNIPDYLFKDAVGRTRDIQSSVITPEDFQLLKQSGRPTRLLVLNGYSEDELPAAVLEYLRQGEKQNFHQRALIRMRNPWYRMESRMIPPFLFAYLGRRSARFIRNTAGVVPLTGFLCVYPRSEFADQVENIWDVLNDTRTVANLIKVGKSYGDGAIKVEPRSLERLPIPMSVLAEHGIRLSADSEPVQLQIPQIA